MLLLSTSKLLDLASPLYTFPAAGNLFEEKSTDACAKGATLRRFFDHQRKLFQLLASGVKKAWFAIFGVHHWSLRIARVYVSLLMKEDNAYTIDSV